MLPMLEIDNKIHIPQSMSIARFLAREFGFHGKSSINMARFDYISDCFYDILDDYMRLHHDKDGRMMFQKPSDMSPTSKKRLRYGETIRRILPFLEKTLEMSNGGTQLFIGQHMTMADMMCYCVLDNPLLEDSSILSSYPKLVALRERVINHPKVSPYLKKRSKTNF